MQVNNNSTSMNMECYELKFVLGQIILHTCELKSNNFYYVQSQISSIIYDEYIISSPTIIGKLRRISKYK